MEWLQIECHSQGPVLRLGSMWSSYSSTVSCKFWGWILLMGVSGWMGGRITNWVPLSGARIPGWWVGGWSLWMKVIRWMDGRITGLSATVKALFYNSQSGARIPGMVSCKFEDGFYEWEWVAIGWKDYKSTVLWLGSYLPSQHNKNCRRLCPSLLVFLLSVRQREGWLCLWRKELNTVQGHKRLFLGGYNTGNHSRQRWPVRKSQIREFADFDNLIFKYVPYIFLVTIIANNALFLSTK